MVDKDIHQDIVDHLKKVHDISFSILSKLARTIHDMEDKERMKLVKQLQSDERTFPSFPHMEFDANGRLRSMDVKDWDLTKGELLHIEFDPKTGKPKSTDKTLEGQWKVHDEIDLATGRIVAEDISSGAVTIQTEWNLQTGRLKSRDETSSHGKIHQTYDEQGHLIAEDDIPVNGTSVHWDIDPKDPTKRTKGAQTK